MSLLWLSSIDKYSGPMQTTFNVIIGGDAVTEVDALVAALIEKKPIAIPDTGIVALLENPSATYAPCVVIGDTYGKPPRLVLPPEKTHMFASHIASLSSSAQNDPPTVSFSLFHARDPSLLLTTTIKPHIVVLCFTPVVPSSFEKINEHWMKAIDRLYPRPAMVLCGTRGESLASRTVTPLLKEHRVVPIQVEEICDMALKWRAVTYVEVSAMLNTNIQLLEDVLCRACVGEPEKRLSPDSIATMRQSCIQSLVAMQSVWSAKRNPKNNKLFFYNRITKKAVWTRPADYDGEEPELTREERLAEELKKQLADEMRLEQEREEADMSSYRQQLLEFESRMSEKSQRLNLLSAEVNRMQTELDSFRELQQANINERQALERQKEELGLEEVTFSKTSVDVDREMEAKLQIAKSKVFEFEAVAALRAEDRFATEISESLIANRGLAASIRAILNEEVAVQQQGSSAQASYDVARKRLEDSSMEIANMDIPIATATQNLFQLKKELGSTAARENELNQRIACLRSEDESVGLEAFERHSRCQTLRNQLENLEDEIRRARLSLEQRLEKDADLHEVHRLTLVREKHLRELARVAAAVAEHEVCASKRAIELEYLNTEMERVCSNLLKLFHTQVVESAEVGAKLLESEAYSPIAPMGLETLSNLLKAKVQADHLSAAGVSSDQRSQFLIDSSKLRGGEFSIQRHVRKSSQRGKKDCSTDIVSLLKPDEREFLEMLDSKVATARVANAATIRAQAIAEEYSLLVHKIATQRTELQEALALAREAGKRYSHNDVLSEKNPLERLSLMVEAVVHGDGHCIKLLHEVFTSEILLRTRR